MMLFRKKWFKITLFTLFTPILLASIGVGYFYYKQEEIVHKLLQTANKSIVGEITIDRSHISLFQKFPYISIDLKDTKLYKDKSKLEENEVIHLNDLYVGFNLIDILQGNYTIKAIELQKGHIDITQDEDGNLDIMHILGLDTNQDTTESEMLQFALSKIDLDFVEVSYHKPKDNISYKFDFEHIHSKFSSKKDLMTIGLDTKFLGSITKNGKQTLMHRKTFALNTDLKYYTDQQKIVLAATEFSLEHIFLNLKGSLELEGNKHIDLELDGKQDNFNLLIAFAPAELIPTLKSYDNKGQIYLKGTIKGDMKDGRMPAINAEFGCEEGLFKNQKNNAQLHEIEFHGTFTNGEKRDLSSMKFTMNKLKAQPAAGIFDATLSVENFNEPDIDLKLNSNFNLDFLIKFLDLENEIKNPHGSVKIAMNFHDIIDLTHPEKSLEKLNESYFTELIVKDLGFESKSYPLPINNFNVHADINGNKLTLDQFQGRIGRSDISIMGTISDIPAILHQAPKLIDTKINISANHVDISELTYNERTRESAFDEIVDNFEMDVAFKCNASDLFASNKLPIGEFVLHKLTAKLQNYPHLINEVSGGLFIETNDIKIKKLKGKLDESDFLVFGKLENYQHLFKPTPRAKSEFSIFFKSNLIKMDNLLSYKGEDFLPESLRNETFTDVKLKAKIGARFVGEELRGTSIDLSKLELTTSLHEKRFSDLNGKIFLRKNNVALKNLKGKIGSSDFDISLNYFMGADSLRNKDNTITFLSNNFNLNEILAIKYNPSTNTQEVKAAVNEQTSFTVNDIPFMDIKLETDIKHFEYLHYKLDRIKGGISMYKNGILDFYRFGFDVGEGKIRMTGKLDASNPNNVTFTPSFWIKNLVLDQTLLRFQNFGQDYILSENLSGKLNAKIKGSIPLYADLTPKIDASNLTLDITILDGELRNYKALNEFASFFGDKNLNRIRFDTLHNVFTLNDNLFTIPWMTINSSIGFIEVAGTQMLNDPMDLEYYLKIPLKLVTNTAYQKLFKRREEDVDPEQVDEIQFQGEKRIPYINLKMIGNIDDFSISLGKDKREKKKK